jgi:hypothetical protein
VSIRLDVGAGPKVYDTITLRGLARDRAIEPIPTVGLDLGLQIATDLEVASRPELKRSEMRGASAQSVADIVTRNDEIAAIVALAPHGGREGCPYSSDRFRSNRSWCRDPARLAPSSLG